MLNLTIQEIVNGFSKVKSKPSEEYIEREENISDYHYPNQLLRNVRKDLYKIDIDLLDNLLVNNYNNRHVMRAMTKIIQSISDIEGGLNHPESIRYYFKEIGEIPESHFGYTFLINFMNRNLLVIKTPRIENNKDPIHEYIVGFFGLNNLRKYLPNFSYVYSLFKCSPAIVTNNELDTWCTQDGDKPYVCYEFIKPGNEYCFYIYKLSVHDILSHHLQLVLALKLAYERYDYTHYDLHLSNIIFRETPGNVSIAYRINDEIKYINCSGIPTIIDYGLSHIRINNVDYGFYGREYSGIRNASFPLFDVFKLLTNTMFNLMEMQKILHFSALAKLLKYFTNEDPYNFVAVMRKYAFNLPLFDKLHEIKLDNYINYFLSLYPDILTDKPMHSVINSNDKKLSSEEMVFKKIETKDVIDDYILLYDELGLEPINKALLDKYPYEVYRDNIVSKLQNNVGKLFDVVEKLGVDKLCTFVNIIFETRLQIKAMNKIAHEYKDTETVNKLTNILYKLREVVLNIIDLTKDKQVDFRCIELCYKIVRE